ncbi:MAG TPA: metal ABC transporter permease [Acidimicrobiia bacterium]|jgi:zinc/manganese transport system permease protein
MSMLAANPFAGIAHMLGHPFLRYAFIAGTGIAIASGLVGYFIVLRQQVFTGDALSHVAFTGALAALAAGINLRIGLYGACILVALLIAALGNRGSGDDTTIGIVFAWILGLGAFFLTIYTTSRSGTAGGTTGINVLFGSIFGLSRAAAQTNAVLSLLVAVAVIGLARPLLFASIDDNVAGARGVPVRALGFALMFLVGVTAAQATQAIGALLLLGLLAAPAGAAQRLTARPFAAMWLSAAIALLSVWTGLSIAYAAPKIPPSFAIVATTTGIYLVSILVTKYARSSRLTTDAPAPVSS